MLSSALRGNIGNGSLKDFKKRLLNTLARNISGYRGIFGFPCYFVNFIDINNSVLGLFDIIIRRLNKAKKNILDIFSDIACFG